MLTVTEIVGMEVIKKVRPELKEYKFIPVTNNQIRIPVCNKDNRFDEVCINLDMKLKNNSDIIRFGINDKHKIVTFKITDEYGWSY